MSNSEHKLPFALRGDLAGEVGFHDPCRSVRKDGRPFPISNRFAFFYTMSDENKRRDRWIFDGYRYMLVNDANAGAGVLVFDQFVESVCETNPNVAWTLMINHRQKGAPFFSGGNAILHATVSGMVLVTTIQVAHHWCRMPPNSK